MSLPPAAFSKLAVRCIVNIFRNSARAAPTRRSERDARRASIRALRWPACRIRTMVAAI